MHKTTFAARALYSGLLLALVGCSTQSGPGYSAYTVTRPDGEQAYRVSCQGIVGGRDRCYAKATEVCAAVKQPLQVVVEEAPLGVMAGDKPDTRVLTFRCAVAELPKAAVQDVSTPVGVAVPMRARLSKDASFATDRATLQPYAIARLNKVIADTGGANYRDVKIDGHTDNRGTDAYNQQLSKHRAEAVAQYLKANGLKADRFEVQWFGRTRPIASNATAEGRSLNRRVEIQLIP